jgi:hypothetical protein
MGNIIESLSGNLRAKLPLLLIGMMFFGCVIFSVAAVIPQWKVHEELAGQINDDQQVIVATMTAQNQSDNLTILQRQIEGAQSSLNQAGYIFLTQGQVDDLLRKIYVYADASGAKIANLQEQSSGVDPAAVAAQKSTVTMYDTRVFHLQVNGGVIPLINFVVLLREASLPGIIISELKLVRSDVAQTMLTMTISVLTSPLSDGKAYDNLTTKPTPVMIALAATPTLAFIPTATPTSAISTTQATAVSTAAGSTVGTATLVGQCTQHNTTTMGELKFSQIQQASGTCDGQIWNFKIDKATAVVMDVVRRSGSGLYRIELHDSSDKVLATTLSSVDGRGILVANAVAGSYSLNIVPLAATGTWVYNIAIWPGLPALSFSYAQNSYSSHTGIGPASNTMIWSYALTGASQTYHIESTRTDGNLEYDIVVLDSNQKQVATSKSSNGNAIVDLTSGAGTYIVHIVTVDGTSGSYRILLVH